MSAPDPCRDMKGQRHHIIPAEAMAGHQKFLAQIGFALDQPANMIRLPSDGKMQQEMKEFCDQKRPIHLGRHPTDYRNAISDKLTQIESRLNSGQINNAQARGEVNRLMGEIRAELSSSRHGFVNDASVIRFIRSLNF